MAVGLVDTDPLLPVPGIRLAACPAGICRKNRPDLAVLAIEKDANVAAVFTRNAFCAAPVILAAKHLGQHTPAYLLINAGNANAGNGRKGIDDALACCDCLAGLASVPVSAVLPYSTGVIGEPLPVDKICNALPALYGSLDHNGWDLVSRAIMTTDTLRKGISRQFRLDGKTVTITGIAKGSGMIKPDMATMLAFIATDAAIEKSTLQELLAEVNRETFSCISVDGDTSTNDACTLVATGRAGNRLINNTSTAVASVFRDELLAVCRFLSQAIIRDGEGATKFVTLDINGGRDEMECRKVAETIAHSPLIKTALFASDPNWGRILAAVGRSGLADLDIDSIQIYVGEVCIVTNGGRAPSYTEAAGSEALAAEEITIRIELHRGNADLEFWTCDLSHDYVRINAEYRT